MKKMFVFVFLVLQFSALGFAQRSCLPDPFPNIYRPQVLADMQGMLSSSDSYKAARADFLLRAKAEALPDTFVPHLEDTVTKFLASERRSQRQYILRLSRCLRDNDVITPLEKQALDRFFEAMLQNKAGEALRAAKYLSENAASDLGLIIGPIFLDLVADYDDSSGTAETQSQVSGGDIGGAVGTIVGAISGLATGGLGGALVGATLGSAVGKAVGNAVQTLVDALFGKGDELEEGGEEGGGDGGSNGGGEGD
ncbi:MAG: hypothetical protein KC422_09270 [Trueperaceae bacterium]|nr:hypothetical protein [Trueperaceae bacterium]